VFKCHYDGHDTTWVEGPWVEDFYQLMRELRAVRDRNIELEEQKE